ncbi:hypothetical protein [Pseudonocardia humida]|uniref:DNA-binding MarR family transcriptional regulator n=1 Tax=Pseudonocardia humida TaxID=2800819 RepID=A0ABT1A531_9PSEU|nr:hypothetical protein [Pseudonocardia humida]MCO1658126.1 hypothetical protein [Pseudonocardia humida]
MSQLDELEELFGRNEQTIRFRQRPDPIPGDLRMSWRFGALALVLLRCRGQAAGNQQLHLLMASLRSPLIQATLLRALAGQEGPSDVLLRNDPSLTRTVKIADALGLVKQQANGTVRLTDDGKALGRLVSRNPNLFQAEKTFLDRLPMRITQKEFNAILAARK